MKQLSHVLLGIMSLVVLVYLGAFFIPWQQINRGNIGVLPGKTITVTGTAESKEKNQVASFSAGVDSVSDDKNKAIAEVNQKITAITKAVKDFGIASVDIQTQNMSIFQSEEQYYEGGIAKSRPGQWRVNNSINIKLRSVEKASELAQLLSDNGATNVYGPNFSLNDTNDVETKLLGEAVTNARKKAEAIAQANNRKIGQILNITEGNNDIGVYPKFDGYGGGGGMALEPGTGTVKAMATVVFELK